MITSASSLNRRITGASKERGAALITALMVATLVLAAGGALILTTGMSATTSIDATAEMQAYYGAEAGLQQSLNALRGNLPPLGKVTEHPPCHAANQAGRKGERQSKTPDKW